MKKERVLIWILLTGLLLMLSYSYVMINYTVEQDNIDSNSIQIIEEEPEVKVQEKIKIIEKPKIVEYKEFEITGYCACEICCGIHSDGITASGKKATQGKTIAVDTNVIPLGKKVVIEGFNTVFEAQDTGSAIKENIIDVYFESHEKALQFGRQKRKVWILND